MNHLVLAALQATLALAALLLGSSSVSAMLCEGAADEEPAMTSQLSDVAPGSAIGEQPRRLRCELDGGDDCDLPPPDGEPQVPQPQGPQRPRSALRIVANSLASPGDDDIPADLERGQNKPGFTSELFRPPKNT